MAAAAPVADVGTMFPTEYLGKDEQLLLSRKPKLAAFLFPPAVLLILIGIVLTIIGYASVLALVSGTATSLSGVLDAVFLFYLLPFIGWILILVGTYRWRFIAGTGFGVLLLLLQIFLYPVLVFYLVPSFINSSTTVATWLAEELGLLIGVYIVIGIVIPIPLAYLAWKKTFYGVTNKRTMKVSGILSRNSRDAPHDKMQDVTMDQPVFGRMFHWGNLTFATAASAGGGSGWRRERDGLGIYWYGIDNPIETRTQVHEIVENAKQTLKIQEFQQMAQVFQQTGQAMGGFPGMAPGGMPPGGMGAAPPAGGAAPAGSVRYCSSCGTPNSVASKFCSKCGAAMPT